MKKLIAHLVEAKHITDIWINEEGQWMTHAHADYPLKTTRDYVIQNGESKDFIANLKKENNNVETTIDENNNVETPIEEIVNKKK